MAAAANGVIYPPKLYKKLLVIGPNKHPMAKDIETKFGKFFSHLGNPDARTGTAVLHVKAHPAPHTILHRAHITANRVPFGP